MRKVFKLLFFIVCLIALAFIFKEINASSSNERYTKSYGNVQMTKDTTEITYIVTYKDGTTTKVKADTYLWDNGIVKFFKNDTIKVKEFSTSIIEDVKEDTK